MGEGPGATPGRVPTCRKRNGRELWKTWGERNGRDDYFNKMMKKMEERDEKMQQERKLNDDKMKQDLKDFMSMELGDI